MSEAKRSEVSSRLENVLAKTKGSTYAFPPQLFVQLYSKTLGRVSERIFLEKSNCVRENDRIEFTTYQPSKSAGTVMKNEVFDGNDAKDIPTDRQQESCREVTPSLSDAIYKEFFNACKEMTFVITTGGKLSAVNQKAVEIFGYESIEEILGLESIAPLFWDVDDLETLAEIVEKQSYLKGFELPMRTKNGTKFMAFIAVNSRVEENGTVYYQGRLRDISDQSNWQRAFIESERRVIELLEAEQQNKRLNADILRMLMIMSHDIRSPLVAMAATLKLLIRGTYGPMDKSVENTVKDLLTRVIQLLGIAEDFLGKAYSIDGSIEVTREVLDLRQDVIDPVLDELSHDIEKQQIMIDSRLGAIPAGTIQVNVNKTWLKAVFRNLFKNAIKYGGRGCTIAFGFEDHGAYYRLNVYNSGRPVPDEYRDKLFTRFGRIGCEAAGAPDGMGLGLYLIREILVKYGGNIWYEPKDDGSDFVFTIPKDAL